VDSAGCAGEERTGRPGGELSRSGPMMIRALHEVKMFVITLLKFYDIYMLLKYISNSQVLWSFIEDLF
jgi:hypothetical protein